MAAAAAPGPGYLLPWAALRRMRRDPLVFLTDLAAYGPVSRFRIGCQDIFLLTDPDAIEDVLVTRAGQFAKGRALERARRTLGDGLLTSEGAVHLRQRRLMQPAFHRARTAGYAGVMARMAVEARDGWVGGRPLDLAREMNRLTLAIVSDTLFGSPVGRHSDTARVQQAITDVMEMFDLVLVPFAEWLIHLPLPRMRRYRAAQRTLDRVIFDIIAARRAEGGDRGDLLSMLLHAQDPDAGGGMTDRQLRDEVITLFLAGHETTANALNWTWVLLSRNPEAARPLYEELDRVLGDRAPAPEDVPHLPYTRAVVAESMRLFPPAWVLGRRALQPYHWRGYEIPANGLVLLSQWVMHRDPRFWPEPDRFDPARWLEEARGRPRFAYFPFGAGARVCIGEHFAWTEAMLVVAAIAQKWQLVIDPAHPIEPHPLITLRVRHGLQATPVPREPGKVSPAPDRHACHHAADTR